MIVIAFLSLLSLFIWFVLKPFKKTNFSQKKIESIVGDIFAKAIFYWFLILIFGIIVGAFCNFFFNYEFIDKNSIAILLHIPISILLGIGQFIYEKNKKSDKLVG